MMLNVACAKHVFNLFLSNYGAPAMVGYGVFEPGRDPRLDLCWVLCVREDTGG